MPRVLLRAVVLALAASGKILNPEKVAFVTQTTLSVDDTAKVVESLQKAFPDIRPPRKDDICYATTNRQNAVKEIAPQVDVFIVVGSKASSNANRLREVAERLGARAYLVDDAAGVNPAWFSQAATKVALTAGASTPEHLVEGVLHRLAHLGHTNVMVSAGAAEAVEFRLPSALLSAD